jgi:hypothetical protein
MEIIPQAQLPSNYNLLTIHYCQLDAAPISQIQFPHPPIFPIPAPFIHYIKLANHPAQNHPLIILSFYFGINKSAANNE